MNQPKNVHILCSLVYLALCIPSSTTAGGWVYDLAQAPYTELLKGQFNPLPGEGIKQLIYRLGETTNQIESALDDYYELAQIERTESHCPYILYASDFDSTGTVIDQPGYYVLCDDIEYSGAGNAITIRASHVTIDLNFHSIINSGSGQTGILIDSETTTLQNISIKNGTISNFSDYGIYVNSSSSPGAHDLLLRSLILLDKQAGIFLNGTLSDKISNCFVRNCTAVKCNSGLRFNNCQDIEIHKCNFNNNTENGADLEGINKCRFLDCHFNNNSINGIYVVSDSELLEWYNCSFNNNWRGIFFDSSTTTTGFIFKNCHTHNNGDLGFNIFNGIGGIFEQCTAISNGGADQEVAGMRLTDCQDCLIKQCICSNNHNNSTIYGCFGILLVEFMNANKNNRIIECITNGNQNSAETTAIAAGIKISALVSHTVVENCHLFSNKSNSGSGYGIINDTTNSSIITGCVAGGNDTNFGGGKPAKYAARNQLGSHDNIGKFENIALETVGTNDVGCITYLDSTVFPLIIESPGHYIMCEDAATTSGQTAVTIQSSYVTFDMNNKQITTSSEFDTAITVTEGNHNIIIKNGSISEFNHYGIFIDENCHHVDIENINISDANCTSAITFNGGADQNEIHDCSIINCSITSITPNLLPRKNVVDFINCHDIHILNSHFNFNGGTDIININLENALKVHFINCTFNDCEISGEARIMNLIDADSLLIDNCIFNNNGGVDDSYIITGTTSGSIIRNSTFNANTSTNDNLIIIYLKGGQGNLIESCLISNNAAATTIPTPPDSVIGILLETSKNMIKNCTILSNYAPDFSYGIQVSEDYNTIIGCTVLTHTASNPSGTGIGIQIDSGIEQTLIKDCLSFNNTTTGINNEGSNSIIVGCQSGNNSPDYYGADALDFDKTGSTETHSVFKYDNVTFVM